MIFAILVRHRRKILWAIAITTVLAVPGVFLIPVKYKAESVILTPQQAQSSISAMASAAGAGAAALPLALLSGFGLRNPSQLYIGILEGRTISDDLIKAFDLKRVYNHDNIQATRRELARNTTIESGKDSLIHIQVEDRDPRRAANIANAYVEELSKQNSRLALTEASERRVFYERELAKEKDALADAEVQFKNTEQATGLVMPGGQAEALIRSGAQLRATILAREAQIAAMKTYATNDNARLQIAERELDVLQAQLSKLEQGDRATGVLDFPTGQLPEASLKYIRKFREVKYHETLFEILAKQYEAARLDEAKTAPVIQVVDRAVVPEKKSWPPRLILVILAVFVSALITSCFVLLANTIEKSGAWARARHSI
jgi:uncharacterized protein involved in exopolysaccharide biosynthesis